MNGLIYPLILLVIPFIEIKHHPPLILSLLSAVCYCITNTITTGRTTDALVAKG